MHQVIVYSKPGCHLCEAVISILAELSKKKRTFELTVIDITKDESILEKYFLTIPVVSVDGQDVYDAEEIGLSADRKNKLDDLVSSLN